MRVDVVGASGTFPVPGRPASGYLITQGETRVWCDAGPGTFMGLPVDSDMVDAVVVSHQHPDHCADLFAAFHAWHYRPEPRNGVPLYAPEAVWERISEFLEKGPGSELYDLFDFNPVWTGDEITIGELEVRFTEMDHSVPTVGSRWEANNRTMFFTGDTGPDGDWRELARDVDVMLCEASYQGAPEDKAYSHHLTASEAGEIAREVGAGRLVLTHIPPYYDVAKSVHEAELAFDRPVTLATPGAHFDV
ncbi:MAG: MBL fold metallo-hydrolase [Actinobacteria bacterium]|nr:MBL fold metallo-hydrolase [Actinomycetota bacterium]